MRGVAEDQPGRTRAAEVVEAIRADILNARLLPGERLMFEALKERFNVGVSPLREALTRIAAEGLVTLEEHKGFRVAPVSRADLTDLVRLRGELEALAIRWSIENGDDRWEAGILATMHELGKKQKITPAGEIDMAWEAIHQRFHTSLVAACGSERTLAFRQVLGDQAMRYRRLSVRYLTAPRDDLGEHRELAQIVIERRATEAVDLIKGHFSRTAEIILAATEEAGGTLS